MRVTNIDTLSALFDRLATERIKEYNFEKQNKNVEAEHQRGVVKEIKLKIDIAFDEAFSLNKYEYVGERRTFDEAKLVRDVDAVIKNELRNE